MSTDPQEAPRSLPDRPNLRHLELNSDLPTDPLTQLTIAQFTYVSNIVTFPVKKP